MTERFNLVQSDAVNSGSLFIEKLILWKLVLLWSLVLRFNLDQPEILFRFLVDLSLKLVQLDSESRLYIPSETGVVGI